MKTFIGVSIIDTDGKKKDFILNTPFLGDENRLIEEVYVEDWHQYPLVIVKTNHGEQHFADVKFEMLYE
ncbi:hypothetical protein [Flammeovirga kamogawensis]|uniref:Uncharacterized protein n=1 Tax=Flammeovirga kamogawensis TaxID=373891 RepID=A0ABX8GU98_9BACT|nr:hypothetical protein [Flammeovirga kamogawensis]MBB6462537.1 hypothetical protein [Flammeovirga kamogawensis]QWG06727.1 hypothetical protein KM029_15665 [Flammeovirga kamogawensis]TRX68550.1 hypothetical protein EO216_10660 [Flammeovirga kamogawensis]